LFINRKAREAYDALMDAIDEAPVIPPCQVTDPELWFSTHESSSKYTIARNLCNRCPVRAKCLEYALANEETYGMFGGLTPNERRKLKTRAARGRPRK
jgi:WhiB family redox-sensing transcriptional regulator